MMLLPVLCDITRPLACTGSYSVCGHMPVEGLVSEKGMGTAGSDEVNVMAETLIQRLAFKAISV